MKSKYTKEFLEPIVIGSKTFSEVIRKISGKEIVHGSRIAYIKNKLNELGIDYSHFLSRGWNKDIVNPNGVAMDIKSFIDNYLSDVPKKRTSSHGLKKYLFKFKLKIEKCESCGITDWNGKEISFHLDHDNGIHSDNRLENLNIFCPNCHSQTGNYAGKSNKRKV